MRNRPAARVLVVTVCAGDPPAGPLSALAQSLHAGWGSPRSTPELRRAEDRAALALLGAEALHLHLPDCIYRRDGTDGGHLYDSEGAIFGSLHPREWWLSLDLAKTLADFGRLRPETFVYVPLGIGRHVDHQLTWHLADEWAGAHPHMLYYEDYPYAHDQAVVSQWVEGRGWTPDIAWMAEAGFERKLKAIAQYHSQLDTFWPDAAAMAAALRQHAASVAEGRGLAERVWYNPRISSTKGTL